MIYCRNVVKRYRNIVAIDRVSLEVQSGICAIVGPNGAGKSTLLKLLAGALSPAEGEIRIAGMSIAEQPVAVKARIGVVPEDLGLFDRLTLNEQFELSGRIYGLKVQEIRDRALLLLRMLKLEKAQNLEVSKYSYGMRKKAALAMALIHNPRVLILDEPFEGLDPVSSKGLEQLLTALARRGVTVLFTSHVLTAIQRVTSFIVIIRSGRIVWESANADPKESLEKLYFEMVETPAFEDIPWLGH